MIRQRCKENLEREREECRCSGRKLALLLLPLLVTSPLTMDAAAPLPPDSTGGWRPLDTLWSDFRSTFTDAWLLFGRPLHFDRQDWIVTGSVIGSTSLIMVADEDLRSMMQGIRGTDGDRIVDVGNLLGENETGLIVAGLLYIPGLVLNEPEIRMMGRHVGQTLLYAAALGALLKHSLGRHRPYLEEGQYRFEGPWQSSDMFLSLPSGHTVVAFSIASSLAADIENPWATVGLYTAATLTALSRVYIDRHWSSDVFVAATLASAIGYGTANLHEAPEEGAASSFIISPTFNGISLSVSF